MRRLDKSQPYAIVYGLPGVIFEQDGYYFDGQGGFSQLTKTGFVGDRFPKNWGILRLCYFIMGNAGSCTRLVSRILCSDKSIKTWGSIDPKTPLFETVKSDNFDGLGNCRIAFKHDGGMGKQDSLKVLSEKIRKGGFDIFWIFLIRRPAKYELREYQQPLNKYMECVNPNDKYVIWDSSLMFLDAKRYLNEMGLVLGLDFSNAEEIYDADKKWIKNVAT